jgi:MoaA/NifB/PqqE/SkfB family radical SAM enzyme
MRLKEVRHLLTYSCNLECVHCYLSAEKGKSKVEGFSQEQSDRFYGKFQPEVVSATGGEPLLETGLVKKIAKSTAMYGGKMELVTNGFMLTENLVAELNDLNPHTFYQISLDGNKTYHNYLRQNSLAFDKAISAIDTASLYGAFTKVRLTATDDNFDQIPSLINLLDSYKRGNIQLVIRPVISNGRAQKNKLNFQKDFESVSKLSKLAENINVEVPDNAGQCGCGVNTIAINPKGEIFPCTYFTSKPEFKMGDMTGDLDSLSEHPKFQSFGGVCFARSIRK